MGLVSHRLSTRHACQARNARAYAIGYPQPNGFHVRRIVWGLVMAKAEKRDGEHIRRAILLVERTGSKTRVRSS